VLNNPLSYADPSGLFLDDLFDVIGDAFEYVVDNPQIIIAIGVGAFTGGAIYAALPATLSGTAAGFAIAGAVGGFYGGLFASMGDWEAAAIGAASGAAFGYIGGNESIFGEIGRTTPQRVIAHGVVGGTSAELQGGKFGSGFFSAAGAKWATGSIDDAFGGNVAAGTTAITVVGGTISQVTGGKFANGAVTAAFGYLFNAAQSRGWLQRRADRLAAKISARGYFTGKGEADWLYQINSDPNLAVTVDASRLTATVNGEWKVDSNGGFQAPAYITGEDYAVHGQVLVRFRPDGTYGVYNQPYDFELHADFSLSGFARNFGVLVGGPPGGYPNTPYLIRYHGNITVTNPY